MTLKGFRAIENNICNSVEIQNKLSISTSLLVMSVICNKVTLSASASAASSTTTIRKSLLATTIPHRKTDATVEKNNKQQLSHQQCNLQSQRDHRQR